MVAVTACVSCSDSSPLAKLREQYQAQLRTGEAAEPRPGEAGAARGADRAAEARAAGTEGARAVADTQTADAVAAPDAASRSDENATLRTAAEDGYRRAPPAGVGLPEAVGSAFLQSLFESGVAEAGESGEEVSGAIRIRASVADAGTGAGAGPGEGRETAAGSGEEAETGAQAARETEERNARRFEQQLEEVRGLLAAPGESGAGVDLRV